MANVAAGFEAIGQAATPELCLVEVNAAPILHNVTAEGGDIADLRRSRQRRSLCHSGAAPIDQCALGKLG